MSNLLYTPDANTILHSNLTAFLEFVKNETGKDFSNYGELHRWSVQEKESFWSLLWKHSGICHSRAYNKVIVGHKIQEAIWFPGVQFNFAENLLRHRNDNIAVIYEAEDCLANPVTYNELFYKVAACAKSLKELSVSKGDRVAGILPNSIEPIIAMLATVSLGAIWCSCSPDFGAEGIFNRFGQIEPKVLFATDGYYYNGKYFDCTSKINHVLDRIPSIKSSIISMSHKGFKSPHPYQPFDTFLDNPCDKINFIQSEFDHPVYILFSSGTTGKPKCIVHGAGGTLLQHYKELALHTNLKKEDTITYFTTCGWMMWNWMVSSLFMGSTLYVYDGSPAVPDFYKIWETVDKYGINILGLSPKYLSLCQQNNIEPQGQCQLNSLRTILSTGSPLSEDNFSWVYSKVKKNVQLASISGGTDIISCFVLGHPHLPVYQGQIQCIGLGMDVKVFDDNGYPVENEIGELVCLSPFPSRPVFFWSDENKAKYNNAYFSLYNVIWKHGDYIKLLNNNGLIIYGRSDSTLNPGGVRIGTAEIYNIVEGVEGVIDSLVCEKIEKDNNTEILLFVQVDTLGDYNQTMEHKIKAQLKLQGSPRHVPTYIFGVTDLPRTMSGKKMELLVKNIMNGREVDNKEVLVNPEILDSFYRIYDKMHKNQLLNC